jgi:hypothetical protein
MKTICLFRIATAVFLLCQCVIGFAAESSSKKATPPSKAVPEKKVYELPKSGQNISRQKGGWINAEAVGTRLVLKFFDSEKKPVAPDVEKGLVQFRYPNKNPDRAPLYREGDSLVTPATVRPPHNFLVILTLSAAEAAEPGESYTFKYP